MSTRTSFALAALAALMVTTLSITTGAQAGNTTTQSLTVAGVPIYAIEPNGHLFWFFHQGAHNGSATWANRGQRIKVGEGWQEGLNVFKGSPSGSDGVVYRVDSAGDLYWYRHTGHATGAATWVDGKKVGNGWQGARLAFAGGNGVVYVIDRAGDLQWYRHLGYRDGSATWANNATGAKVGVGWSGMRLVFAGGDGVIYAIDRAGDLFWYRHTGHADGTFVWANGASGIKVGNGWGEAATAFAGGKGVIYAMKRDGNLYWYSHSGAATGAATWAPGTGNQIGNGWGNTVRIF